MSTYNHKINSSDFVREIDGVIDQWLTAPVNWSSVNEVELRFQMHGLELPKLWMSTFVSELENKIKHKSTENQLTSQLYNCLDIYRGPLRCRKTYSVSSAPNQQQKEEPTSTGWEVVRKESLWDRKVTALLPNRDQHQSIGLKFCLSTEKPVAIEHFAKSQLAQKNTWKVRHSLQVQFADGDVFVVELSEDYYDLTVPLSAKPTQFSPQIEIEAKSFDQSRQSLCARRIKFLALVVFTLISQHAFRPVQFRSKFSPTANNSVPDLLERRHSSYNAKELTTLLEREIALCKAQSGGKRLPEFLRALLVQAVCADPTMMAELLTNRDVVFAALTNDAKSLHFLKDILDNSKSELAKVKKRKNNNNNQAATPPSVRLAK